jgi:hypothetical protein
MGFPAQNQLTAGYGSPSSPLAINQISIQYPILSNPMFGRPIWSYIKVDPSPVRGPQPRLAQGTGRTGNPALPGNAAALPGYLSDQEYFPTLDTYGPTYDPDFMRLLARSIHVGSNGRSLVGTYQPHDFTPADRWIKSTRRAANWQVMEYPPDNRNLLQWQQVQKYRVSSLTLQARPLASSNYFLGYQVQPTIQAQMGQTTLGSMGSN